MANSRYFPCLTCQVCQKNDQTSRLTSSEGTRASSRRAQASWLEIMAIVRGSRFSLSLARGSAPCWSRNSTETARPSAANKWRSDPREVWVEAWPLTSAPAPTAFIQPNTSSFAARFSSRAVAPSRSTCSTNCRSLYLAIMKASFVGCVD